jgi:uncharacterized protein YheU (UPF0270 family)
MQKTQEVKKMLGEGKAVVLFEEPAGTCFFLDISEFISY